VTLTAQSVRIVVGFGAGSTPDVMARAVANHLQMRLGKPFVVENKSGAGGNLGLAEIARADGDVRPKGAFKSTGLSDQS
jgi:tripartite-type tricarboxylate transporter receptor subunit TctC